MITRMNLLTSWQPFFAAMIGGLFFIMFMRLWLSPWLFGKQWKASANPIMFRLLASRQMAAGAYLRAVLQLYFLQFWLVVEDKRTLLSGMLVALILGVLANFGYALIRLMMTFSIPHYFRYIFIQGSGSVLALTLCGVTLGIWL
jgi:hypothetical protein